MIRIGSVTLIAESSATLSARGLLACLVGFGSKHRMELDQMMRSLREFAAGRSALVLFGYGDLTSVAAERHRTLVGEEAVFVVGRRESEIEAALAAAIDGALCMTARQLAFSVDKVLARMRSPESRTRFVIYAPTLSAAAVSLQLGSVASVAIAPLEGRRREIPRIIDERTREAAARLQQATTGLDRRDRAWLRAQSYRSFAELDQTVRRVVATRTIGVTGGATMLGLTHSALSRWAQRRSLPTRDPTRHKWVSRHARLEQRGR